jgi:hypothetical protein
VPGIEGAESPRKMVERSRHFRPWDEKRPWRTDSRASYVMDVSRSRESQNDMIMEVMRQTFSKRIKVF